MIFIFEDNGNDMLSCLFREAYPSEESAKFVYAKGNGNIENTVNRLLGSTNEKLVVFLDTIPGNEEIYNIYRSLERLSRRHGDRVFIVPLICSEYYFIKSIAGHEICPNSVVVQTCLSKSHYSQCTEHFSDEDRAFCKSFEKFCKLILKKFVHECVQSGSTGNSKYRFYVDSNCLCSNPLASCPSQSKQAKSIKFLKQFPTTPYIEEVGGAPVVTDDGFSNLKAKLVKEINEMSDRFKHIDGANACRYKTI